MSHDQNFKNLILDYPWEALGFFAAEEVAGSLDGARILPLRQEQLKDRLGDRFRELDVPLLVEWPNGEREALLFVFEEETEPRRFSIHRLIHYCVDLAELFDTERVVPVVIFLHRGQFVRSLKLGGDTHSYLSFHYLSCELATLPFADYQHSDNIVARLNLPNMNYPVERRVEVYASAVRGLIDLEHDPEKRLKYLDFIDIYASLNDDERTHYQNQYPREADIMTSFAERFRQEGMQQGIQQGMQQGMQRGMQRGEARILLRQMQTKFGQVPVQARHRIEEADAETLLEWSDRLLAASSLDEVFH